MLALLASAQGRASAAVEPLTLYQKIARAPLVVRARALSDATRRPRVEVTEVFKGSPPSRILTVAPHLEDQASPTPWLKREVFHKGEESILFLTPYLDEFGRDEGPDTFALLNADQGKLEVPSEGADALVEALRRIVAVNSLSQHDLQAEALRGMLGDRNPYLVEAALTECAKFRLAESGDIGRLMVLIENRRDSFRAGSLALVAQVLTDASASGRDAVEGRAAVFEKIAATARLDSSELVRTRAVDAIEAFADRPALSLLENIGVKDASQSVRYAAQVGAYRLREKLH